MAIEFSIEGEKEPTRTFYVLAVRSGNIRDFGSKRKLESEVEAVGLTHQHFHMARNGAERLSKLPFVDEVVVSRLDETPIASYRNGEVS